MEGRFRENKGSTAYNDSYMYKEATSAQIVFVGQKLDIRNVLSEEVKKSRLEGRQAIIAVFDATKTLARQGLPFRGQEA